MSYLAAIFVKFEDSPTRILIIKYAVCNSIQILTGAEGNIEKLWGIIFQC